MTIDVLGAIASVCQPAAGLHLRPGDRIIEVNGVRVADPCDPLAILRLQPPPPGASAVFKVERSPTLRAAHRWLGEVDREKIKQIHASLSKTRVDPHMLQELINVFALEAEIAHTPASAVATPQAKILLAASCQASSALRLYNRYWSSRASLLAVIP
jgi:membrane-associated protease RseP (regulator of RpoE activity)